MHDILLIRGYDMTTIKSYQEQVQDIVAKAIDAVESQHKAIAEASFGYAERLYKLDTAKTKHDEVATLAYDKAREANKYVGSFAGDLIAKYEKPQAPAKKAATKAKSSAKKVATTAKKSTAKATTAAKTTAKKVADSAKAATA
jgi:hypothetical protein